jgi:3-oxoacyl-[acyl-carrier protein] reductase
VTGASASIGKHLAEYYVAAGYQVIGCSRRPVADSERYRHFSLDITDDTEVRAMFAEIRREFGRLDILINNAGVTSSAFALSANTSRIREMFDTNLLGSIICSREAAKLMSMNSFGRVVMISSVHVPFATVGSSIYSSSKAGVEQFTKVFAKEVASFGVTANTLGLSVVEGSGMAEEISDETTEQLLGNTVTGKHLKMEDVTNALDFLISDESGAVTSQTIYIGGA